MLACTIQKVRVGIPLKKAPRQEMKAKFHNYRLQAEAFYIICHLSD